MGAKESYNSPAATGINSDDDIVAVNIDRDTVADWTEAEERAVKVK
jgi:hypothetical protein